MGSWFLAPTLGRQERSPQALHAPVKGGQGDWWLIAGARMTQISQPDKVVELPSGVLVIVAVGLVSTIWTAALLA